MLDTDEHPPVASASNKTAADVANIRSRKIAVTRIVTKAPARPNRFL